jgi:hypothetical protein
MTEIEAAEKIVEEKWCKGVECDECPANLSGELRCKCGEPFGFPKTESQLQWFKDFLKGAKCMNGIDKAEAKKRLDAIEKEARELREIIEKGDRIEYDGEKMYIWVTGGDAYILHGIMHDYAWIAFCDNAPAECLANGTYTSAQSTLDSANDGKVHVFTDTRKAFEFFLENYKGEE